MSIFLCLLLPWVNPFAAGPSPSVTPWLTTAAFALAAGWLKPAWRLEWRMGLIGVAFLAALLASGGGAGAEGVMAAGGVALILVCASMMGGEPERGRLARLVALSWLAAASISSIIALCQYFGVADRFAPWMVVPGAPEAYSNLRQRNQFASLASLGIASLVWLKPGRLGWMPAVALTVLMASASAASVSRTGAVQMLVLALLALAWRGGHWRGRLGLCAVVIASYSMASLALPRMQAALLGGEGISVVDRIVGELGCSSRKVLWSNVIELIGLRPMQGWGWGELDFAHYTHLYAGPRFCDILDNAHNLPLQLAVELGIPAAAAFCIALLWACVRARPWAESDGARQWAWACLLLVMLHSAVEYPLWYGPFQMVAGFSLGLLWPPSGTGVKPARVWWGRGAGAVLSCALAYAAWDYTRVSQIYLAPEDRLPAYRDRTMEKARESWLFSSQAKFAELTTTTTTPGNANEVFELSGEMLHYSPEARVIEKRIESAALLDRADEVRIQLARYRAAFPDEFARWAASWPGSAGVSP